MSKSTAVAAAIFFSATLGLSYISTHQGSGTVSGGVMDNVKTAPVPAPAVPAPATGAAAIPTAPAAAPAPASAPAQAPAGPSAAASIPK